MTRARGREPGTWTDDTIDHHEILESETRKGPLASKTDRACEYNRRAYGKWSRLTANVRRTSRAATGVGAEYGEGSRKKAGPYS
jgi:hypothetical protein